MTDTKLQRSVAVSSFFVRGAVSTRITVCYYLFFLIFYLENIFSSLITVELQKANPIYLNQWINFQKVRKLTEKPMQAPEQLTSKILFATLCYQTG
jgi:hypothetical protein